MKTKRRIVKKNSTKKANKNLTECDQLIYKPFEKNFVKSYTSRDKSMEQRLKQFISGMHIKFKHKIYKPVDNFYLHINDAWLDRVFDQGVTLRPDQKYIVEIDDFRLTQDKVYHQLIDIIHEYIKHNKTKTGSNLHKFYNSAVNGITRDILTKEAKKFEVELDNLRKDKNNIWKLLAMMNANEITSQFSPFSLSITQDIKNSKTTSCYLNAHTFLIVDISVYYDNGTEAAYKNAFRNEYAKSAKQVLQTCIGNNNLDGKSPFVVEQQIFSAYGCTGIASNANNYNVVTSKDALEKYNFNWVEFCKAYGFSKPPETFIVSNLNYFKCCTEIMLKNWDSEEWKGYWMFNYCKMLARLCNSKFANGKLEFYNFNGSFSRGLAKPMPANILGLLFTTMPFNKLITKEYVSKYADEIKTQYVKGLYNDLIITFQRIIRLNTWLNPTTKKTALEKLKSIRFIANTYPYDEIMDDPDLNYTDNFFNNMMSVMNWRVKKNIQMVGKKCLETSSLDWNQTPPRLSSNQAFYVDAAYTPSKNNIFINLGYIQEPFINLQRNREYNLARIGFTMSHEMSHSLDDWGCQYDKNGNLDDWWTDKDKKKYKQIQDNVITQYETWAKREGVDFNASASIGEDLADMSGLTICEIYLLNLLNSRKVAIEEIEASMRNYHLEFATQERQRIPRKALSAQLKTNPHPPDEFRTNVPLSRSAFFINDNNVKKGDGMYWPNQESVWVG